MWLFSLAFYALNGGIYFASNQVRESFDLGAPGSIGNTCNIPGIVGNPNPQVLQLGQVNDRFGVKPGDTEGFLENVCPVIPNCHTFATQHLRVETSDGTQLGSDFLNSVAFYCSNVDITRQ